jgi:hypothetical protein
MTELMKLETDQLVTRFAAMKTAQRIHYSLHDHLPLNKVNSDCVLAQDSNSTSEENRRTFRNLYYKLRGHLVEKRGTYLLHGEESILRS